MPTCLKCQGSKKQPNLTIASLYCDVCGFGFLLDAQNAGRTCNDPKRISKGTVVPLKEETAFSPFGRHKETLILSQEDAEKILSPQEFKPLPVQVSASNPTKDRVYEAIKAHPLIGKGDILKYAHVTEEEYTEAKESLLSSKRIVQEGERRGAKYKVSP